MCAPKLTATAAAAGLVVGLLSLSLALSSLPFIAADPVLQVQLLEQKLTEQNNTIYVHDVMRLAKSAEMSNYMKLEAQACDNFYQYACGNWAKLNPADALYPRETNIRTLLGKAYDLKLLRVIEEAARPAVDAEAVVKAKRFYESCLHFHDTPHAKYVAQLKQLVADFGHMPILMLPGQEWPEYNFDWLAIVGQMQQRFGLDILLRLDVRADVLNQSANAAYIDQPQLSLAAKSMYTGAASSFYRNAHALEIERQLVKYLDLNVQLAAATAADIVKFEVSLAKGMVEGSFGNAQLCTLAELQKDIDMTAYWQAVGLPPNGSYYALAPDYLRHLFNVSQRTPPRIVANYVFYRLLQHFFYDTETVAVPQCLATTKRMFAQLLDNMVYRKYNMAANALDVSALWLLLKQTLTSELERGVSMRWMSASTRQLAIEKLAAMQVEINAHAARDFNAEYAALHVAKVNYVANMKAVLALRSQHKLQSVAAAPTAADVAILRPYAPTYVIGENVIKVPVALLQSNILWSDTYPKALKFGTLGYLLARELLHGFMDDAEQPAGWWDTNTTLAYLDRKQCFKKQYALLRLDGQYLAESELQAENIADNGAIQLAHKTYLRWLTRAKAAGDVLGRHVESLPNLQISSQQLFFVSFAQYWCNDINVHFKDKVALLDTHTPNALRVIGALSNFHAFAKVFRCGTGSAMNPAQKSLPIFYILAIVPGLMPWDKGYKFLSFCHLFGSVAPWCGSFVYHLFMNIDQGESVYYTLLKLDMIGIWVSQSFGALPMVTATTFCFTPILKWFIIISYCLLSLWGLYKALTATSPWQRRLCFGLPFIMRSVLTYLRIRGFVGGSHMALYHVFLQDGVSILGGAIGAMRIPEKWFPGLVDYYLNSHNIMHVLVVVAVYSMHKATIKDFEWMSTQTCNLYGNYTVEPLDEPGLENHAEL